MAVHMPRNAERIPDHAHLINYANGELVWASQDGDIEEPISRLKEEDIIFVLKQPGEDGYLVYSLVEQPGDSEHPFKLSALLAPTLPEEVLKAQLLTQVPDHLLCDANHRLSVVVSTRSGMCLAQHFYDEVLRPLLAALRIAESEQPEAPETGYDITVTQSSQTIRNLARDMWGGQGNGSTTEVSSGPARTIVLLSGDGGVVDLLNGCSEPCSTGPRPSIVLLPLGTGNALFHSLHKPHYLSQGAPVPSPYVLGLRTLFRGASAPLPTFKASFSPNSRLVTYADPAAAGSQRESFPAVDHLFGAIVASYGFHASLVWESDTPEHRRHGDKRFGIAARELLTTGHAYRAVVEPRSGGTGVGFGAALPRDTFGYVLVAMVSNLETTFTISPASAPLSGDLRLVHFGDVGGTKTMDIMMAAYNEGSHVGMTWTNEDGKEDGVGYDEIDAVKVTVLEDDPRWRKVCIDGAIVELEQGGWMAVEKSPESRLDVVVDRSVLR